MESGTALFNLFGAGNRAVLTVVRQTEVLESHKEATQNSIKPG